MAKPGEHGPRLTDEEYDRAVIELHRGMPPMPTREEDRARRRRALDLAIDHRLGRNFPRERREALWNASERVESKRIWIGLKSLLGTVTGARAHAEALTRALGREFGKVLTPSELEQFLGPGPLALPIDDADRRRM
jgi:hypothetical protein